MSQTVGTSVCLDLVVAGSARNRCKHLLSFSPITVLDICGTNSPFLAIRAKPMLIKSENLSIVVKCGLFFRDNKLLAFHFRMYSLWIANFASSGKSMWLSWTLFFDSHILCRFVGNISMAS